MLDNQFIVLRVQDNFIPTCDIPGSSRESIGVTATVAALQSNTWGIEAVGTDQSLYWTPATTCHIQPGIYRHLDPRLLEKTLLEIIGHAGKPSSPEVHECINNA